MILWAGEKEVEDFMPKEQILQGVKLAMFDWSGVVSDDRKTVYQANIRLLTQLAPEIKQPTMEEWLGHGSVGGFLAAHGISRPAGEIEPLHQGHLDAVTQAGFVPTLYPGADEVIKRLAERGIKLTVISTHPAKHVMEDAERYGIAQYFDGFLGSVPDKADAMRQVSERMGILLDKAFYIGDTAFDIVAARRAGVRSVGITTGYHTEERLASENPDFVITNLTELFNR